MHTTHNTHVCRHLMQPPEEEESDPTPDDRHVQGARSGWRYDTPVRTRAPRVKKTDRGRNVRREIPSPPLYDLLKENTTGTMAKRTKDDCIPKPLNEPTQATSGQRKEVQRHISVSRAGGSGGEG